MPRKRKPGRPSTKKAKKNLRRGRKPIFTDAQKRVLAKMVSKALRASLKKLVKAS